MGSVLRLFHSGETSITVETFLDFLTHPLVIPAREMIWRVSLLNRAWNLKKLLFCWSLSSKWEMCEYLQSMELKAIIQLYTVITDIQFFSAYAVRFSVAPGLNM